MNSQASQSSSDLGINILYGLAYVIVLYIGIAVGEAMYLSLTAMWKDRVELFPDTYASGSTMHTAIQNPTNPNAKTIYFSDNRRNGIEFTYTMFINIKSSTFSSSSTNGLRHIFHKGYSSAYPLMGPGIFSLNDKNTLRIYMNSFETWKTYTEVNNIPVEKWFHLTVSCKGNTLYIYINGNLKQKMAFPNNTPPYQNYGNAYLFNTRKRTIDRQQTPSVGEDNLNINVDGSAHGMVSRVYYFSYALTYSEIQSLITMGPSSKITSSTSMSMDPYLADTWWTNLQDGKYID
jgi:hypothetical protein